MHASASMPPTPQPNTPMPLTIGVCESVPTSVSGSAMRSPVALAHVHHRRQVFEVHLVHDAHARRHDTEAAKRLLRPAQQHVPLAVALVLALDVALVRRRVAEGIHLHRVVDDEVDRHLRVDGHRIAAGTPHGRAHRGEVHHGRDAGEVLQQHARRDEGALPVLRRRAAVPARQRLDVALAHEARARVAHDVLEQDLERHRQARHVADARVRRGAPAGESSTPSSSESLGSVRVAARHLVDLLTRDAPGSALWRLSVPSTAGPGTT